MVLPLSCCGTKSSRFLSVVEDFGGWVAVVAIGDLTYCI